MKSIFSLILVFALATPCLFHPLIFGDNSDEILNNGMDTDVNDDDLEKLFNSFSTRDIDEPDTLPGVSFRHTYRFPSSSAAAPPPSFMPYAPFSQRSQLSQYAPFNAPGAYQRSYFAPASSVPEVNNNNDDEITPSFFRMSFRFNNNNDDDTTTNSEENLNSLGYPHKKTDIEDLTSTEVESLVETVSLLAKIIQIIEQLDEEDLQSILNQPQDSNENEDDKPVEAIGTSVSNPNVDVKLVFPGFEFSDEATTAQPDNANEKPTTEAINSDSDETATLDESDEVTTTIPIATNFIESTVSGESSPDYDLNALKKVLYLATEETPSKKQKVPGRDTEWDDNSDELGENDIKLLDTYENDNQPIYKVMNLQY